eukprot:scaffold61966_cov50-Attheya_sp.AAC.1
MALERRCLTVLSLTMPAAQLLSTWRGVGGWGWPISSRMIRKTTPPSRALKKQAPSLASVAEARTTSRMEQRTWMAPFMGGGMEVGLGVVCWDTPGGYSDRSIRRRDCEPCWVQTDRRRRYEF